MWLQALILHSHPPRGLQLGRGVLKQHGEDGSNAYTQSTGAITCISSLIYLQLSLASLATL